MAATETLTLIPNASVAVQPEADASWSNAMDNPAT
jgi:hypothetical protein